MWDPYADFEKKTLSNGLDVYLLHCSRVDWVRAGFVIHAGACQDKIGKEGTAHLVEHVVSENISIGDDDLTAFFKSCGGSINLGMTDYLHTQYDFFLPAVDQIIEEGFGYMSDMLIGNVLQNYIEREKNIVLAEFLEEYPIHVVSKHFLQHKKKCYEDTFLARFLSPAGKYDSIIAITQKDIQEYYDKYYVPENMSIVFIGNISWDRVNTLLCNSNFSKPSKGYSKELSLFENTGITNKSFARKWGIFAFHENGIDGVEQSLYRSMAKLSSQYTFSALDIFAAILNQNLFVKIREELSATYEFYAQFYRYHNFVEVTIKGKFDSDLDLDIDKCVQSCIDSIAQDEELFACVQMGIINEISLLDVNGRELLHSVISDIVFNHRIKALEEEIKEMKNVTFEDIISICEELAQKNRYVYIQVP